jgi:hypothetical protein
LIKSELRRSCEWKPPMINICTSSTTQGVLVTVQVTVQPHFAGIHSSRIPTNGREAM